MNRNEETNHDLYKDDDLMSHVRLARRRSGMQCGKDHRKVQSDVIHWQHCGKETGHQTLGFLVKGLTSGDQPSAFENQE